ncbi:sugar transferase [Geitlerinema calcuttense]|nr:sugar transferase [Geitlerinema calcuttense]
MSVTEYWTAEQWQQAERAYLAERPGLRVQLALKRLLDIILASLGMVGLLPVFALVAIAICLDSPGPIFFIQERLGKLGQPFPIYKFRTMVDGAVHLGTGLNTFEGDPRVTRIGKCLREYHLDELPQLWNVLRGEMSLVGPRPLLVACLSTYNNWEKRRLLVSPGITGWEAVKGGLLNPFDSRIALDVWYVDRWTLWLDLTILARTIQVVLNKEGVYGSNGSERSRGI